jgi:hypothetical protein
MKHNRRLPAGIAGFLEVEFMQIGNAQAPLAVGLNFGIGGPARHSFSP